MFKYYGQSDGLLVRLPFLKGGKYMIDHIPYIHLIEVYNEKYFYDVNTNGIIHISDEMYDFFEKFAFENINNKETNWERVQCIK